jgi:hypothetical protein
VRDVGNQLRDVVRAAPHRGGGRAGDAENLEEVAALDAVDSGVELI